MATTTKRQNDKTANSKTSNQERSKGRCATKEITEPKWKDGTYGFLDRTKLLKLLTESGFFGMPCQAT
jgi:hypothetical protein